MGLDNVILSHCEDCRMFVVTGGKRICVLKDVEVNNSTVCEQFQPIMDGEKPYCPSYCGVTCINGYCPNARGEDDFECGYVEPTKCAECFWYKGCEDCAFEGSDMCPNVEKEGAQNDVEG